MERISISPIRMSLAESPKALPTSLAWNRKFFLFLLNRFPMNLFFPRGCIPLPIVPGVVRGIPSGFQSATSPSPFEAVAVFRQEAHPSPSGVVAFQLVYLDVLSLEWSSIPSKVAVEVRVFFQASEKVESIRAQSIQCLYDGSSRVFCSLKRNQFELQLYFLFPSRSWGLSSPWSSFPWQDWSMSFRGQNREQGEYIVVIDRTFHIVIGFEYVEQALSHPQEIGSNTFSSR